jgi:hypothetical protein
MTAEKVRNKLASAISEAGSAVNWARHYGVSPAYVSDVLKGHKAPGKKILAALGLVRVIEYQWSK